MGWGAEMGSTLSSALLALGAMLCTGIAPARAFTVKSGFTEGCHEHITLVGYVQARTQMPPELALYVPDGPWEKVADYLLRDANFQPASRAEKFFLFSLLTGVRAPDNEGFSLSNISTLRAIHANPNDQYGHCLRAVDDDGLEGNETAVQGCRDELVERLGKAADALQKSDKDQIGQVQFTLDQYGTFDVDVWIVAYHVGRALHAVEDSFTHTLRTPDMHGIVHVMNYAEAVGGTLDEERDGLAHSSATDACNLITSDPEEPANRDRVFAAEDAAADLLRAAAPTLAGERVTSMEVGVVLDRWLRYVPGEQLGYDEGCIASNDYCNSQWVELARFEPTGPILSCALAPQARNGAGAVLLLLALASALCRRRRAP
jgi:hypothetical protein